MDGEKEERRDWENEEFDIELFRQVFQVASFIFHGETADKVSNPFVIECEITGGGSRKVFY